MSIWAGEVHREPFLQFVKYPEVFECHRNTMPTPSGRYYITSTVNIIYNCKKNTFTLVKFVVTKSTSLSLI
ncbi:hypothetical protein HanRHA438_Chr00c47g0858241 [Helianthus annuus]|nr:hypothetical protein HanIR_Chr09g0405331 [Helianthus annuus]KAJ0953783.1 hypothetical protein HanRHA438_Chr00c47g0858241 [Helianthus annuus]